MLYRFCKSLLFSVLPVLLACSASVAKRVPVFEDMNMSGLAVNSTFDVDDWLCTSLSPATGWQQGYCFKEAQGRVILEIGNAFSTCPPASFSCNVRVLAEYYSHADGLHSDSIDLTVFYDARAGVSYREKDVKILAASANYIKVTLLTISNPAVAQYLSLRAEISEDRQQCTMDITTKPSFVSIEKDPATDEIVVTINNTLQKYAEEYDLEWTFIDDFDQAAVVSGGPKFTFRNNATRVTTENNIYRLRNVFEQGYVMFRVRAVAYYTDGAGLVRRVAGAWSLNNITGYPDQGLIGSNSGSYIYINNTTQPVHEAKLNWQYMLSFAEGARKNDVITYYDGSMRQRQSVAMNYADATSIVQETIYDFEGRPAITTLPVPVKQGTMHYYENFNRNAAGDPYSANDFDLNAGECASATAAMAVTSGASAYYSTSNGFTSSATSSSAMPDMGNYVPVAGGFPFIQTEFTADNTGRIRAKSSPGPQYVIGGVNTHETKMYYDVPEQQDLDRLFGTEAGDRKHYKRQTVVDANGQGSVSYQNMSGKVIATALVGNSPVRFEADMITPDDEPQIVNGEIIINKTFNVPVAGIYGFKYEVMPQKYLPAKCTGQVETPQLCYDCIYDLEISLKNACGTEQLNGDGPSAPVVLIKRPVGGNPADTANGSCDAPLKYRLLDEPLLNTYVNAGTGFLELTLAPGTYTLVKTLKVKEETVEAYLEHFMATQQCKTLQQFETEAWDNMDKTGCEMTCASCTQELQQSKYASDSAFVAYKTNQYTTAGGLSAEITADMIDGWKNMYHDIKATCDNICGKGDACEVYRDVIISDMSPGGQYASFTYDEFGLANVIPTVTGRINILAATGAHSYKTVFASGTDKVVIDGAEIAVKDLSVTQFVRQWDLHSEAWAPRFIQFHPEYCELDWCSKTSGSRAYDETMMGITTYNDAVVAGLLSDAVSPYSNGGLAVIGPANTTADPLFSSPVFAGQSYSTFYAGLWSYKTVAVTGGGSVTLSLWDVPVYHTYCNNVTGPAAAITSCISSNRISMLNCKAYKDYYWNTIKGLYLAEKNKKVDQLKAAQSPVCNPVVHADAEKRFFSISDAAALATQNMGDAQAALANSCQEQCSLYRPVWKEKLQGCYTGISVPGSGVLTEAQLMEKLLDEMEEICRKGCDPQSVFGASSVSPDNYSDIWFNSFEEVLKAPHFYQNGSSYVMYPAKYVKGVCDDVFITMPKPYGHDYYATSSPEANTCGCNAQVALSDPNCPCDYQPVTAEVNRIIMLSRTDLPEERKCKNCIDCFVFASHYKEFLAVYAPFDEHSEVQQQLITAYMNKNLGFNLQFADYREHVVKCLGQGENIGSPFAKFTGLHITPLTTSEGLNNNTPAGPLPASPGYVPYANKLVDCSQFLNYVNAFMADQPLYYLIQGTTPEAGSFYTWIQYYETTPLLGILLSGLNSTFAPAVFDKEGLIQQFKHCLPLDCREFETRWQLYGAASSTRREILEQPYYSNTFLTDIQAMNAAVAIETNGSPIWSDYLNKFSIPPAFRYPLYAVANIFSEQTVKQYIDMCPGPPCRFNITKRPYNSTIYHSLDAKDGNTGQINRASHLLSVLFKKINGQRLINRTAVDLSTETPEIFPVIPYKYRYPASATYSLTSGTAQHHITGRITAGDAPPLDISIRTVLLYSNVAGSYTESDYFKSYVPVQPSADFQLENIVTCNFVQTVSYNYSEAQFLYKLGYSGIGENLKTQYVLVTLSGMLFKDDFSDEGCYPKNTLCNRSFAEVSIDPGESPCLQRLRIASKTNARKNWEAYIKGLRSRFRNEYISKCLEAAGTEKLVRTYPNGEYHYTLYYYDQVQNLVKTVPPAGVVFANTEDVAAARAASVPHSAQHTMVTLYAHNSLNSLVWQRTPDAGDASYYYDEAGRIVLSQNAEQYNQQTPATNKRYVYSYTLYDDLSRISEVGELRSAVASPFSFSQPWIANNAVRTWINTTTTGTTAQATKTWYDIQQETSPGIFPYTQENLRSRVTKISYHELGSTGAQNSAVHYSYDVQGNVKKLIRQVNALHTTYFDEEFRTVDYDYDLVSGKVNRVVYQAGQPDQYIHEYGYDMQNRLTYVSTGVRRELMDVDATYRYYRHGPLSRTQLGKHRVQGIDYAYTLQGWLKGVNSGALQPGYDMGRDGFIPTGSPAPENSNRGVAPDEFGFILQYFEGDYAAAGGTYNGTDYNAFSPATAGSVAGNASVNLYNGNIRMMTTAIGKLMQNSTPPLATAYTYDKLSRLEDAMYYNNFAGNAWQATGTVLPDYRNTFTYDANGNIKTQVRNGSSEEGVAMDNLTYEYEPDQNRLKRVNDQASASSYNDDIKDQSGTNYTYDRIGNLVADENEKIAKIEWNVYGKIKKITRTVGSLKPDLEFEYTPDGHRSVKIVIPKTPGALRTYTYYVRDAQGNIMATYIRQFDKVVDFENLTYAQVNARLAANAGQSGFAEFIAHLHTTVISSSTGLRDGINNNMKALPAAAKETFLENRFALSSVLTMSNIIGRNMIANMPEQELQEMISQQTEYNTVEDREVLLDGRNGVFFSCYNNPANGSPYYDNFVSVVCADPDMLEAYLRFLYEANELMYTSLTSAMGIQMGNIDATILEMRTTFNPLMQEKMWQFKGGPGSGNALWLGAMASERAEEKEAFTLFLARYYKRFLVLNQQAVAGDPPVAYCFGTLHPELYPALVQHYTGNAPAAWDVLLGFDNMVYKDTEDPAVPPVRDANYYLDRMKDTYKYDHLFAIAGDAGYASYITAYQQAHNLYSGTGNGIRTYLGHYKNKNGQAAYDLVINHFLSTTNSYSDSFNLSEHHIYGSGRLGVRKSNRNLSYGIYDVSGIISGTPVQNPSGPQSAEKTTFSVTGLSCSLMRGEKSYELTNHLGNVMVVVSDKRLYNCSTSTYVADVMNANDYSPFGAPLAGRSWNQRIILDNRFTATTETWSPLSGGAVLSVDNGQLKITASNTCSIEKQVVAEPGMVYELVFDMNAGTFSDLKVEILESVASGKPVNTSYTTIRNGKHSIYFKAVTNEIFLRFTPQTNLTGSRSAYINYITLRRVSSRPAPGSIVYTENMTLTSRTGNTPSTYTASSSITFDSGFESGASDEFQTFVEPTIFVSDGMERDDYRFGFNGKEKDDETYGEGNEYDYGFRIYSSRLGRFLSVDPLTKIYPMLTPFQFASNTPIQALDVDGREGYQFVETLHEPNGTTCSRKIVMLDVYVAVSDQANSVHYNKSDLRQIEANLNNEYNNGTGFVDATNLAVVFRFNMKEFNVDEINSTDFATGLRRDPNNIMIGNEGRVIIKGMVLEQGVLAGSQQGLTNPTISKSTISVNANDASHTQGHEVAHGFLNYDGTGIVNPVGVEAHDNSGGIFLYKKTDKSGNTIQETQPLNQDNVDTILKTIPSAPSKEIKSE
jgi:RHS repeat-associated protein